MRLYWSHDGKNLLATEIGSNVWSEFGTSWNCHLKVHCVLVVNTKRRLLITSSTLKMLKENFRGNQRTNLANQAAFSKYRNCWHPPSEKICICQVFGKVTCSYRTVYFLEIFNTGQYLQWKKALILLQRSKRSRPRAVPSKTRSIIVISLILSNQSEQITTQCFHRALKSINSH